MDKRRVVVAMSGGVDSSVAAALLSRQGYEVIGMTMCFNLADGKGKKPACCGIQGIEDARRVCHKLGIRHYVVNMQKALAEKIIDNFISEYQKGRTPNPCVRCNQFLKFDILLKKARALGAEYLATGHYARIEKVQSSKFKVQGYCLKKAKDAKRDQSYFLYRLTQAQLKRILFPLGDYTKEEVRQIAREAGFSVADKAGSQEICFLPDNDYRGFLQRRLKEEIRPGLVLDTKGNVLGKHRGAAFYTIGQRQGLGIARGYPVYVARIDARNNIITVGNKSDCLKKEFTLKDTHFILNTAKKKIAVKVRIRYNHKEAQAQIAPFKGRSRVKFKKPQFALTPGQSAVFYEGDTVLGGATIGKVL